MKRTIKAPAKINLCLKVNGKRDDGYHDLTMVMQQISLFDTIEFEKDELNRPIVLSEYGGYGLRIKEHLGCTEYFSYIMYKNKEALTKAIKNLIKNEIYPNMEKGLCAAVYTQLSDIEQEINGFMTYDRKVIKVNVKEIKEANDLIKFR